MNLVMPTMLSWVLGGNLDVFKTSDRRPICHLCDKPKYFDEQVYPALIAPHTFTSPHTLLPAVLSSCAHK